MMLVVTVAVGNVQRNGSDQCPIPLNSNRTLLMEAESRKKNVNFPDGSCFMYQLCGSGE